MNIHFGLANYEKMEHLKKIHKVLKNLRITEKSMIKAIRKEDANQAAIKTDYDARFAKLELSLDK